MLLDTLLRLGQSNVFPFEPVVSRQKWKFIQLMEPTYLQCAHVIKGDMNRFATFVDSVVQSDGTYLYDKLIHARKFDERHIQELLFLNAYTVKILKVSLCFIISSGVMRSMESGRLIFTILVRYLTFTKTAVVSMLASHL